jgi:sulfate transport system ATP-binding protein/putative spermidine/putrescine transport system ATP-binding protein
LKKEYDDFSLQLEPWEILDEGITVLWGPSGSGKTSVFRVLIGLDPCPEMLWQWADLNLNALPVAQRRLGVVFQTLDLFPHLTARQNILFAARARNLPEEETLKMLATLTEIFNMQNFLDRKARVLSGGEKQRTAFARAVIGRPRLLMLDEPFSALDEGLKAEARSYLQELVRATQVPALLVTHDPRDVKELAQKIIEIRDGRIVETSMFAEGRTLL